VKRKNFRLAAFTLMVLSLAAVGLYTFTNLTNGEGVRPAFGWKAPANASVPPPDVIEEMERLNPQLPSLVHPPGSDAPGVNLALFGYEPIKKAKYTTQGKKVLLPPEMNYSLSLAFAAGSTGFCVIDGVFYEEGSLLPDGAKVVTIEPNRVLVRHHQFKHWLTLAKKAAAGDDKEKETGKKA
jgi:hypothetical protein